MCIGKHRLSWDALPAVMGLVLFAVVLWTAARVRAALAEVCWPEASGEIVYEDGILHVDASHQEDGYVCVRTAYPTENRLKMQVMFSDGTQLLYDIDSTGLDEIIPLQLGSGAYSLSLFENVEGTKYASAGRIDLSVQLSREDAALLVPNQYVNYTRESPSVQKSDTLGGASQSEIYDQVCNFMASEFTYDFVRALTITAGELPEVDECYNNRTGICQDLASVMISMLRVQGIPSRLMIGYVDGGYYHAWTQSVVDGEEKFFDPTAAVGAVDGSSYQMERYY